MSDNKPRFVVVLDGQPIYKPASRGYIMDVIVPRALSQGFEQAAVNVYHRVNYDNSISVLQIQPHTE